MLINHFIHVIHLLSTKAQLCIRSECKTFQPLRPSSVAVLNCSESHEHSKNEHTIHHTAPEDYTALENRLLEFSSSTRPQVVTILINDDEAPEPSESFTVRLELQTEDSNVLLIPNEARITINDNDSMLF